MINILLRFLVILSFLGMGALGLFLFYLFLRRFTRLTAYQRINRITLVLTGAVFFGILFLGYNLIQAVFGSLVSMLLLRIAYVIVMDTDEEAST